MLRCKGFDTESKGVIFNCISSFTFHSTTVHLIVLVETENVRSSYASIDISVGRTHFAVLIFSCFVLAASREQKTAARNTTFEDTANSEYIAPTASNTLTLKKFTLTNRNQVRS